MMRIAIAGGGAFAYVLAQELTQSSNAIIVLSSQVCVDKAFVRCCY